MSIKSIILSAAAAATVATAGTADTYFEQNRDIDSGDVLELGLITAEAAGTVEIFDYHTGQKGALLGSEDLRAGANTNVRVRTGLPATRDVIAVVTVDGEVVAQKAFDVN